jgi:hypothetical protein
LRAGHHGAQGQERDGESKFTHGVAPLKRRLP